MILVAKEVDDLYIRYKLSDEEAVRRYVRHCLKNEKVRQNVLELPIK
jgi:hypothetical protein